jgi:ParB-like chromosome segregation protein Spo0J
MDWESGNLQIELSYFPVFPGVLNRGKVAGKFKSLRGGLNVIADDEIVRVDPRELIVRPPFSDLMPIRRDIQERITMSMQERGFDPSKPINVWLQENVVVDGHTRRNAALAVGIEVLACFRDFKDEDEALDYAIANQRDRRNLRDAELASLVLVVDKRKRMGRPLKEVASSEATFGKSSSDTAALVGTSRTKVEKVREIEEYAKETGDSEEKDAVLAGKKSINMASNDVKAKRQRQRRTASKRHPAVGNGKHEPKPAQPEPERSADDEAYLASFPLYARFKGHRFGDDLLIYRAISPMLDEIRKVLPRVVGQCSIATMGPFRRAIHGVATITDPSTWLACDACQGKGYKDGQCRTCKGCGYEIART